MSDLIIRGVSCLFFFFGQQAVTIVFYSCLLFLHTAGWKLWEKARNIELYVVTRKLIVISVFNMLSLTGFISTAPADGLSLVKDSDIA